MATLSDGSVARFPHRLGDLEGPWVPNTACQSVPPHQRLRSPSTQSREQHSLRTSFPNGEFWEIRVGCRKEAEDSQLLLPFYEGRFGPPRECGLCTRGQITSALSAPVCQVGPHTRARPLGMAGLE